ncbi:MAG: hypothetical protein P4L45_07070 [Ignavibacteriaceae bacterium]|nr:hypothetical protein [Ignavibacteriaceae bacterium]
MSKFYWTKFMFAFLIFVELAPFNFGQTSAWGNYEVYSRKTSQSALGYLTTSTTLPGYLGGYQFTQNGILFSREYNIANLGSILVSPNNQINISLTGAFRIGAAIGSSTTDSILTNYTQTDIKYYTATVDLFSMNIAIDYTLILDNGLAIIPKFQLGLIDLGATVNILDHGVFAQNGFGTISLIPFSIEPSLTFDFGRSTLGISFFINPYNILDVRVVSHDTFNDEDRGLIFGDKMTQRFASQIVFSF